MSGEFLVDATPFPSNDTTVFPGSELRVALFRHCWAHGMVPPEAAAAAVLEPSLTAAYGARHRSSKPYFMKSMLRRAKVIPQLGLAACVATDNTLTLVDMSTGAASSHAVIPSALAGQVSVICQPAEPPEVLWVVPDDDLPTAFRIRLREFSRLRKLWMHLCASQ